MAEIMNRLEACCCGDCDAQGHEAVKTVQLSDEEVANILAMRADARAQAVATENEAARIAALKDSAKAKLVAGTPLTEEEAATLTV